MYNVFARFCGNRFDGSRVKITQRDSQTSSDLYIEIYQRLIYLVNNTYQGLRARVKKCSVVAKLLRQSNILLRKLNKYIDTIKIKGCTHFKA